MSKIYHSLKGLISNEMVAKAAKTIDEKESNVSKASTSIIASLLAVMLKKGHTPQIKNILETAGNLNILSDIGSICEERLTQDQQRIGDDFLQHLLGDKAADFTDPIAKDAGISQVGTNRLVSIIAPLFAGYLGEKLVRDNWSMEDIFTDIKKEKEKFSNEIPAGVIKAFGLSSILSAPASSSSVTSNNTKKKKSSSWIVWVVLILLLLLLLFWWRSCRNTKTEMVVEKATVTETVTPQTPAQPNLITLTLLNGEKIQAAKGSVEEEIINFLNSNEYKNAKNTDLQKKWFHLNNVRFEFDSANQLQSGSQSQLNNIVAILKSYKDAKIVVGGFADKKGADEVNMEISRERAKTIEDILDKGGVGSQIVRTQGLGDEYAKHNASESNAQRSEDREAGIRFVK